MRTGQLCSQRSSASPDLRPLNPKRQMFRVRMRGRVWHRRKGTHGRRGYLGSLAVVDVLFHVEIADVLEERFVVVLHGEEFRCHVRLRATQRL